jgi:hypothetical protein
MQIAASERQVRNPPDKCGTGKGSNTLGGIRSALVINRASVRTSALRGYRMTSTAASFNQDYWRFS